ncbi:MAG: hypothetical protein EKK31_26975 [Hyphomicrobiales bacterium]|nr:MAG: hypothetical protein EKK31_26975 [Hyphomicrobiales bacterium]
MDEKEAKDKLKPFLESNPKSEVKEASVLGKNELVIANPWGDASLVLLLDKDADATIDIINGLILPERLSAIYHRDSKSLEVLWTAFKLNKNNQSVFGRKFSFSFAGNAYECEFGAASEQLLRVATKFHPVGPSDIGYRNIASFSSFVDAGESAKQDDSPYGTPSCFWIRGLEYSDDIMVEFLTTLNFYMSYYDDLSPMVLIHPPQIPKGPAVAATRYRFGQFPQTIATRSLDPDLLQFWGAAHAAEPSRRFMYAYRIIEHAAFFFVESGPKLAVRKALMMPHALDDIASTADAVLAAVRSSKSDEWSRFEGVVTKAVDPQILWGLIEVNIESFSKSETFDGGFELTPLVANVQSKDEFQNSGLRSFCSLARKIRNALSHGREEKNATVILPTKANYGKLRPWAALIERAAGEIVLYEHV